MSSRLLLSLPPETSEAKLPSTMATATAALATTSKISLREDLTCAICCDLFREPVMLACMHHFCKPCISRYWRGFQGPVSCPQCRKEFSSKEFQTNYLVAAMVEKVRVTTSDSYLKNLEVSSRLCRVFSRDPAWLPSSTPSELLFGNLIQITLCSKVNLLIKNERSANFEFYKINTAVFHVSVHTCVYFTAVPP